MPEAWRVSGLLITRYSSGWVRTIELPVSRVCEELDSIDTRREVPNYVGSKLIPRTKVIEDGKKRVENENKNYVYIEDRKLLSGCYCNVYCSTHAGARCFVHDTTLSYPTELI